MGRRRYQSVTPDKVPFELAAPTDFAGNFKIIIVK